jgi:hypothetical protein
MVDMVMIERGINADKWRQVLLKSTKLAVKTVKPSS